MLPTLTYFSSWLIIAIIAILTVSVKLEPLHLLAFALMMGLTSGTIVSLTHTKMSAIYDINPKHPVIKLLSSPVSLFGNLAFLLALYVCLGR